MQIGFVGLLQLLFIGLKLGGVIAWSWFWVLSPLWISGILSIVILLVIAVVGVFVTKKPRRSTMGRRRRL